VNYFEGNSGKV